MNRNLEWFEGAPEKLEAGMLIQWTDSGMMLIGHSDQQLSCGEPAIDNWQKHVHSWAWLVKPHELEWHAAMAKTNAKSRPEQ